MATSGSAVETEITQLLYRYASCLDARDVDGVVACFTDDAHVELSGGAIVLDGRDQLRSHWSRSLARNDASTHLVGNVLVELDPDGRRADARSQAVAFLRRGGGVIGRGLRYADSVVSTPAGWRIGRRHHVAEWQVELAAAEIRSPALGPPLTGGENESILG